jgi:hypothetical protein
VGFELEDGDWYTWKATRGNAGHDRYFRSPADSTGVRPMAKHEVLHDGVGVRMEADEFDENGMRLSDVEFVTDPFPLSQQGQAELMQALQQVDRIYSRIGPLRGRDHAEGEFVGPDEHRLSHADVLLSRGGARARLRIQATHGLSLADVPRLYTALSAPPEGQARADAVAAIQRACTGSADRSSARMLESLRSAPERASRLSLAYIKQTIGEGPVLEDTAALLGFLTVVIAFLSSMYARPITGGIKTFLPVMHRNDFATMFALLPPSQRELLRDNETHFVQAVLGGLFGDPDLGIENLDLAAHANQPVVKSLSLSSDDRRAFTRGSAELPTTIRLGSLGVRVLLYRPLPRSMTIERWVRAWMSDRDPADLLTLAHFDAAYIDGGGDKTSITLQAIRDARELAPVAELIDWPRSYEQSRYTVSLVFDWKRLSAAQKAILRDSVRELGGLGSVSDQEHPTLALFENRAFMPRRKSPSGEPDRETFTVNRDDLIETISSYFSGMLALFDDS